MHIPQCQNSSGEQEAWQVKIQRRLDILDNLKLPVRNAVSLRRRASASEQHGPERHQLSPRPSESNEAVATDVFIDSTVTEELSVLPFGNFAPCPLCRISESRTDQSDFRRGDWIDIDVWVDSASRGCNYCRIIASGAVCNFRPYRRAPDNIKLRVRALAEPFRNMEIDMRSRNDDEQTWEFHISKGDSYHYSMFGPYTRVWLGPSKEQQIHEAACAIQDCVENHKACHQNSGELPNRLIEISIVNGENCLRLVETQTLAKGFNQRYIALSHCWGLGQPLRLLKSNFASMKARIPWEAFPRLFRDAIQLTWWLDVHYLWIDVFCIIQDDSLDWQTESARMGDIYRSSFVTVLASPASDSSGTIFAENGWPLLADSSSYVQVWSSGRQNLSGKLHTRAWTFQEFILPRRVLEFGHSGQEFRCCSPRSRVSAGDLYRARFDFNTIWRGRDANDEVWFRVIEHYAGRDLTRLSDRLPALSGLASLYLKQTGLQGRYLAGLWERSFRCGLHWVPCRNTARKISRYHAPSWSWASLTRPIVYLKQFRLPSGRDEDDIDSAFRPVPVKAQGMEHSSTGVNPFSAQVIRVQCGIKGSNPFGEVTGGTAVLRGLLLDARMSFQPNIDAATSAQLEVMHSTRVKMCSGYEAPGSSQPMPPWAKETILPYLADNHKVFLDSDIEMVPASQSLPANCAYLRRRQLERQVDGLSKNLTPEEMESTCLHVSVLIVTCIDLSKWQRTDRQLMTGLVLGRPDPDKEVYERLALLEPDLSEYYLGEEPRYLIGAVKDVTII